METLIQRWDELLATPFIGYGAQPIPSPIDDGFRRLAEAYVSSSPVERGRIHTFSPLPPFALLAFSERMATLSIRRRSQDDLFLGLIGLVLEGFRYDPRESVLILALHDDAASRIGVASPTVFARAAQYAPEAVARQFTAFLQRKPEHRSLSSMGYEAVGDGASFAYRRT